MTAFPTLFDTMKPNREGSESPVRTAYSTTFRHPDRVPERTVCEKSVAVRTRWAVDSTLSSETVGALQYSNAGGRIRWRYADSSVRPLLRRADRMARPARVRMRRRKPCFLARRRLFG